MIASLPMYDHPALQSANDEFWAHIRAALGRGPLHLTRSANPWDDWQSPELLISQTCGYPYRARLHGHVQLVATPDFALPGCPEGYYNSVIIARRTDEISQIEELSGLRFAYNEPLSQSGWAAPRTAFEAAGLALGPCLQSGAHAVSAQMVANGAADFAAIDAHTWQILQTHERFTETLSEVARTAPTPALPYITSLGEDADALRNALQRALETISSATRNTLGLRAICVVPAERYLEVHTPLPPNAA